MPELSRIAVVDHLSYGGVSRFLLALITHLAALRPELEVVYYVSDTNIERDGLRDRFGAIPNVTIRPIASPMSGEVSEQPQAERGRAWKAAATGLRAVPWLRSALIGLLTFARSVTSPPPPAWWEYQLPDDVVSELGGFDVVYLGWPFYLRPASFPTAVVATFHDFHPNHFPEAYSVGQLALRNADTAEWLQRCRTAVVSTRFIADDLASLFPEATVPVEIVYLASYGFHRPEAGTVENAVRRLGIRRPFALYSGGRSAHKNVAGILEAIGILKQQGVALQLAITGAGTEEIGASGEPAAEPALAAIQEIVARHGLVRGVEYRPLGYVSDADVDALTAGADLIVSASLYEAGCGPAMDAWRAGVPVALSDIPPFTEQMQRFGVRAWVFDPRDPADIATKMRTAIEDTARSEEMTRASLHAFAEYGWDDVAAEYYRVFSVAAEAGPTERMLEAPPSRRRFWLARRRAGWFA
ncbi:MAG: glycosyltransferase [Actinobacteria bacterium]|nr:glycosyltransferase [Actinomycetota bacterium]